MITEQHYIDAAEDLGCELAVMKALAELESHGAGFLSTGELRILFEPHIFWRQLQKARIKPNVLLREKPALADILYEFWMPGAYGPESAQWDRLRKAAQVNIIAAYNSASYGRFQIMGFNHNACGYSTVIEFMYWLQKDEIYHLKSFVCFIKYSGLEQYLRNKQFDLFAKQYNGPGYKNSPVTILDDYDYKLKKLYQKWKYQS